MGIRLSRFKLSTSYNTYLVTVQLINGDEFKVFLKDFGFPCGQRTARSKGASANCAFTGTSLQKPRSARPGTMGPSRMNLKAGSGYCWNLWMAVRSPTVTLNTGQRRRRARTDAWLFCSARRPVARI